MGRKYFGTDGIRDRANVKITAEAVLKIGQAAGLAFRRGDHRHRVVIGKDTRLSSYMIEYALVAGFTSVGVDVLLLGPVPTPAVAMLTRSMRSDLGVMISASHNLYEDNGIKLFGPDGFKLSDEIETRIEALMDSDVASMLARSPDMGRAKRIDDVQARYIEYAKRTLSRDVSLEGLRVVIDPAGRDRLRQWRRLQGRARGAAVGARRRGDPDRRRAEWPQHQSRGRLDCAGDARAQGARDAG
jgi:phosphoglucosamine mutase